MRAFAVVLALAALAGCGGDPAKGPEVAPVARPGVMPNTPIVMFPTANLVTTQVVTGQLMGKAFMPGGRLATYRKAGKEYQMFATQVGSAMDAAVLLPDWRKALAGAKLVPSFGGYFGMDAGKPVFVFAKDKWVAGVAGLALPDADAAARLLAAELR